MVSPGFQLTVVSGLCWGHIPWLLGAYVASPFNDPSAVKCPGGLNGWASERMPVSLSWTRLLGTHCQTKTCVPDRQSELVCGFVKVSISAFTTQRVPPE